MARKINRMSKKEIKLTMKRLKMYGQERSKYYVQLFNRLQAISIERRDGYYLKLKR